MVLPPREADWRGSIARLFGSDQEINNNFNNYYTVLITTASFGTMLKVPLTKFTMAIHWVPDLPFQVCYSEVSSYFLSL